MKAASINAIVGPSGAGKTTLLNVIAQIIGTKQGRVEGDIIINGNKVLNPMQIKLISGFLEQDDVFFTTFTPREILYFCAKMRINGTAEYKEQVVDELINDLNLNKCVDSKIGDFQKKGISGGEKRRISLAIELMMNPSIVFLDEPTSGLDSFTALLVMGVLKREANKGRMIVCSIHQPSYEILNIIDNLIVLAGGKNIYNGPPSGLINFTNEVTTIRFNGDYNPVEYLLKLLGNEKSAADKNPDLLERQSLPLANALCDNNKKKFLGENGDQADIYSNSNTELKNYSAGFLKQFL